MVGMTMNNVFQNPVGNNPKTFPEISSIVWFFPEYIITICTGRSHFLIDDKLVKTGRGKKVMRIGGSRC
jgi:hypothetical protein